MNQIATSKGPNTALPPIYYYRARLISISMKESSDSSPEKTVSSDDSLDPNKTTSLTVSSQHHHFNRITDENF
jgi:hypothetical protein